MKVKDRILARSPDPPVSDDKRRDQSAGERESGRDQHYYAEPGDEGLVYGALDVPRRRGLYALRGLRRPEMGLLRLHLAANLPGEVHSVQAGVQAHGEYPVYEQAENGYRQESRHAGHGVIHPRGKA